MLAIHCKELRKTYDNMAFMVPEVVILLVFARLAFGVVIQGNLLTLAMPLTHTRATRNSLRSDILFLDVCPDRLAGCEPHGEKTSCRTRQLGNAVCRFLMPVEVTPFPPTVNHWSHDTCLSG